MGQILSNLLNSASDKKEEEKSKGRGLQAIQTYALVTNNNARDRKKEEISKRREGDVIQTFPSLTNKNASDGKGVEKVKSYFVRQVGNGEREEGKRREERWIKYYNSSHRILLVGEGDFSFSACLAKAFGSANNMVATSLDSQGFLMKNYKNAMENTYELERRGCILMHEVDATKMADNPYLKGRKFDRIVFNFPLVGFNQSESRSSQVLKNQLLVRCFFVSATTMLSKEGEIHMAHKCNGFLLEWNIEKLASMSGLRLIEELPFRLQDYPGYGNKYGYGGDKNFNCMPSKTYKFGFKHS